MSNSPFNLLCETWLPATRLHSGRCAVRPADITTDHAYDPVIAIAWPRPDFRAAALEFLIGLLSTTVPPHDEEAWLAAWHQPPEPAALDAAFAPFAAAFDLDGEGPRFLQDREEFGGEGSGPANLLIDSPGENAIRNNTDLLVKRGGAPVLSRAAAAMALFTLQTYAPSGGAGHRVGFRGGGPLTTLVLPDPPGDAPRTLWQLLWANVAPGSAAATDALPQLFPWLASTRTSGKGEHQPLVRTERNALQMFWAMPRRIRLDFAPNQDELPCGITGAVDSLVLTGWRSRPYGAQYNPAGWTHPLSPHYRQKATEPWLPVHGQPGGIGYRHWAAFVLGDPRDAKATRVAAETVRHFREDRAAALGSQSWRLRLLAAGYDMDNAKPRGFIEAEMPLPTLADPGAREALDDCARRWVAAASITADLLRFALRQALFGPNGKADPGSTTLQAARDAFWTATESRFFILLAEASEALQGDPDTDLGALAGQWRDALRRVALEGFDRAAPLDPDSYRLRRADTLASALAVVSARRLLGIALAGYGKAGGELFKELGLAPPEKSPARKVKGKAL